MVKDNAIEANAVLGNYNRQYVGARYVPKFFENPNGTAEWLRNIPYDALTIVTYLGNSYTSKIPVPPGIGNPSLNPTYWALTGNYNRQVEEYREEVVQIGNQVDILENSVNVLKDDANHFYLLMADSYGDNPNGWTLRLPRLMGWNNSQYAIAQKGGAGFVEAGQGKTFLDLFNGVPTDVKNKITDVILITAGNDMTTTITPPQIADAVGTLIATIKNSCPLLKKISMGACLARRGPVANKSGLIRCLNDINNLYKCSFITTSPCFVHSSYYLQKDNVHLSADGYRCIAYGVSQYLKGNSYYNNIVPMQSSYGNVVVETQQIYGLIRVNIRGNLALPNENTTDALISTLASTDLLGSEREKLGMGAIGNPQISPRPVEIIFKNNQLFIRSVAGYLPVTTTAINVLANFYVSAYEF